MSSCLDDTFPNTGQQRGDEHSRIIPNHFTHIGSSFCHIQTGQFFWHKRLETGSTQVPELPEHPAARPPAGAHQPSGFGAADLVEYLQQQGRAPASLNGLESAQAASGPPSLAHGCAGQLLSSRLSGPPDSGPFEASTTVLQPLRRPPGQGTARSPQPGRGPVRRWPPSEEAPPRTGPSPPPAGGPPPPPPMRPAGHREGSSKAGARARAARPPSPVTPTSAC